MKRTPVLLVLLASWATSTHSASGSLGDSFAKAALASVQAIETDISTTQEGVKAILDPVNAGAKTEPEKAMAKVLRQVYEQKLIDNRLRKAEFDVLDEALNSPDPLIRDYISHEQIAQYDHDDAEMSRREAACFEPLKRALQNHVSENPKPCADWTALAATPAAPAKKSDE